MKLYTWIDVQDKLWENFELPENNLWLKGVSMRVYWDGLHIKHVPSEGKTREVLLGKLSDLFLGRFEANPQEGSYFILLERNERLPIFFEEVDLEDLPPLSVKASFGRLGRIALKKAPEVVDRIREVSPQIFSFHSFKGGVGRTLHTVSFALELSKRAKVLLIDADFEAPGITWMLDEAAISFSDFLALYHGTQKESRRSLVKSVADILGEAVSNNLWILPAFRNPEDRFPVLQVKPEHIYNFDSNPFVLTDALEQLGQDLGVEYILIDLRAGLSELSTGWLLDPRIQPFFVTTISSQSLSGTALCFRLLSRFFKNNWNTSPNEPFLIFSQLPPTYKQGFKREWLSEPTDLSVKQLKSEYINAFDLNRVPDSLKDEYELYDYQNYKLEEKTIFSEEYENLKSLPPKWSHISESIEKSMLPNSIRPYLALLSSKVHTQLSNADLNRTEQRQQLNRFAKNLVFAESVDIENFLSTKPIKNLVEKFRRDTPIAVVVGAKGSGKTFLYKQIVRNRFWERFANRIHHSNEPNRRPVFPVTLPMNMSNAGSFEQYGNDAARALGHERPQGVWLNHIKPYVENHLKNSNLSASDWRNIWLDCIAWSLGIAPGERDSIIKLMALLREKKQAGSATRAWIAVFDGLEDIFKEYNQAPSEQKALEALLQDVPLWLDSQPDRPLGAVIFVRLDMVGYAIKQNEGQFLDRYKDFYLAWDDESALRLVYWIKNCALSGNTPDNIEKMNREDLVEALYEVWGKRLSKSDSTKEAFSYRWILGALANFNKEIQSRDLVRFLEQSSDLSISSQTSKDYEDRLLIPQAIRDSMTKVGEEKIEEVKKENLPLNPILIKLQQISKNNESSSEPLRFPCSIDALRQENMTDTEIDLLEKAGIITSYSGEYYMAEIYRQGFHFKNARPGKPKVLSLY